MSSENGSSNDPKTNNDNKAAVLQKDKAFKDLLTPLEKPWYKYKHLLRLNCALSIPMLTSATSGYDGSLLNGLQSLTVFMHTMGDPTGAVLGALANGLVLGFIFTCWFSPWLSDKYGRKICIYVGASLMLIGVIIQTAANGYACFLVGRLVIGAGACTSGVGSPTLISETAHPRQREIMTALFNTLWYLGATIAAWVTFGTYFMHSSSWAWRIPSLIQGLPCLIQLLFTHLIPESPRYYVAQGRIADAKKVLMEYHTGNDQSEQSLALIEFELGEIKQAIEIEKLQKQAKFKTFFQTKANFHRFLIAFTVPIMMQFSGNSLVSYYLVKVLISIGITSSKKQLIINAILMLYNMIIAWVAITFVSKVNRRRMFLTCLSSMMCCYIVWTALSAINQQRDFKDKSLANGVLAMIFLYYAAYDIGLCGLPYLYLTECLPYNLRSKGVLIFFSMNQLTSVFNGFINPIAMDAIEWRYYIVWTCFLAFEIVVAYFLFPETRGYSLEEVAHVFGDAATQDQIDFINEKMAERKSSIEHIEDLPLNV